MQRQPWLLAVALAIPVLVAGQAQPTKIGILPFLDASGVMRGDTAAAVSRLVQAEVQSFRAIALGEGDHARRVDEARRSRWRESGRDREGQQGGRRAARHGARSQIVGVDEGRMAPVDRRSVGERAGPVGQGDRHAARRSLSRRRRRQDHEPARARQPYRQQVRRRCLHQPRIVGRTLVRVSRRRRWARRCSRRSRISSKKISTTKM